MADFTGEIRASVGETEYRLMLGLRGMAQLQTEYGVDLKPIMSMGDDKDQVPDISVLLRVVDISLERHHPDVDDTVAEALLMQDMTLPGQLIGAAFPSVQQDATVGKTAAGKAKARR